MNDQVTQPEKQSPPTSRKISLATFINFNLVSLLVIFVLLTWIAFSRLTNLRDLNVSLSNDAIPQVVNAAVLNNHIHNLAYSSAALAEADNHAARRIAKQDSSQTLEKMRALANREASMQQLLVKLALIEEEVQALDQLVQSKLAAKAELQRKQQQIYQLQEDTEVVANEALSRPTATPFGTQWMLVFNRAIAIAGKAAAMTKIQDIRQLSKQAEPLLAELQSLVAKLSPEYQQIAQQAQVALSGYLLGEGSLVDVRIEQLKISGRARGRGTFVSNLITDYAQLVEFKALQRNEAILEEARLSAQKVNQQLPLLAGLLLLGFIFAVAITIFTHSRVVRRLTLLNEHVMLCEQGKQHKLELQGDDEIATIAHSFDNFAETIAKQQAELTRLSLSDQLTGIPNRRAMDNRILAEMHTSARQRWWLSVLMIDVDFFKYYNDNYGHAAGDACLLKVADILQSALHRNADFIARFGGEEFVCILPDTAEEGAKQVAEGLRQAVEKANMPHQFSSIADHVTVSIGVAAYTAHEPVAPQELLSFADQALYKAKQQGRNRVVGYGQLKDELEKSAF